MTPIPGGCTTCGRTPDATVRVGRDVLPVRAVELSVEEAAAVWPALHAMNAQYAEYAELTDRSVPVFGLRVT
ncbi:MAG: nitroreductase/quinone reductase family protein [Acidimicrobiales bacterium]